MCKINGHSIFTYLVQPQNAKKLYSSNKRNNQVKQAQEEAAKTIAENSDGDEVSKTASVAQVNKVKKNQSLSSLRVPLENSVGASLGGSQALGLNLGG